MRILVVEDDRDLAGYVRRCLEEENNTVSVAFDGQSGLQAARSSAIDIIVLDVMLPILNGIEVTKRLRAEDIRTPVLLLTARDASLDVVRGFDAGADDYLTKPFSFDVLLARLRARTRSTGGGGAQTKLRFANLTLEVEARIARRGNEVLMLTRTEFDILECLMRAGTRVISRSHLLDTVWGPDREVCNNNVDVFIRFLRAKVDVPGIPPLIHTVRGIGYCLRDPAR
jgi:two-component system response regulator MprA